MAISRQVVATLCQPRCAPPRRMKACQVSPTQHGDLCYKATKQKKAKPGENDMLTRRSAVGATAFGILAAARSAASAPEAKHSRFAYVQPKTTGYGIAGDIFAGKLKELSHGTMLIDQYPGAQLGQEPQVLQLIKAGDIEFCISSPANAATLSPQAGVMSLHFLFRSEDHLAKALADPNVSKAVKAMIEDTVQGAHVLGLITLGLRTMYR